MVSKLALLSNFFFAFVALAVLPSQLGAPRGGGIQSHPSDRSPVSVSPESVGEYNADWAGAQCVIASFSEKFNYIYGTFIVPAMDPNQQLEGFSGLRIAVVLGDIACSSVFLSGVRITFDENGVASYQAMWGTNLNDFQYFPGVGSIEPGDVIKLVAYSSEIVVGQGIVVMENVAPGDGRRVWVVRVEGYKDGAAYVPLANFNKVIFTDGVAHKEDYITERPSNCGLVDATRTDIIRGDDVVLTETMLEGTTLVVTWVTGSDG